jgi:hypothetical protein
MKARLTRSGKILLTLTPGHPRYDQLRTALGDPRQLLEKRDVQTSVPSFFVALAVRRIFERLKADAALQLASGQPLDLQAHIGWVAGELFRALIPYYLHGAADAGMRPVTESRALLEAWYTPAIELLGKLKDLAVRAASSIVDTVGRRVAKATSPADVADVFSTERADAIADDEAYRASQAGRLGRAEQQDLLLKWKAQPGCCKLCLKLDGTTVRPGESFIVLDGGGPYAEIFHPPAHPHCRCRVDQVAAG